MADTQICVVHRTNAQYVGWKYNNAFTADMKHLYNASIRDMACNDLPCFVQKWNDKILMPYCPGETSYSDIP